ncbi:peptidoglycan DD-metalloendopeptidase family protein [Synechococcales cyanobacterium C]|uniref:Peptidoglycan DD-metalloendopeptidase family protein n=2 Tax=Petrachloros TaxID=2918834 RepID=A0A8K1ZYW0_9CYAN|nr:peptidoglycan DD-metalloendopeptidase family protein [Petrachloros mirabilis ULC683]
MGLLGLVGVWHLLMPAPVQASASVDELQKHQELLEDYRSGVSQQRRKLTDLEEAARDRLDGLESNLATTESQIAAQEAQFQAATDKLQQIEADLEKAEKVFDQKQANTVARLRYLQRQQLHNPWATLLQSQTLEQLIQRRHQLKQVYAADQKVLVSLQQQRSAINDQKMLAELQKNQVALLKNQLLAQKSEFEAQAKAQSQLVSRLNADRQALEAAENQLVEDSRRLGIIIQQRLAVRTTLPGVDRILGTGQMGIPAQGPITSHFGWRQHPILGSSRFHSGTDFGAEHGSPIWAADAGFVIFAGWYGGYGNTVVLDHGNGLTTLYAHASEILVAEGQPVQKGQVIAAVGSTGLSTGPHLHFEVHRQGEPMDPLAFL